MTTMVGRIRTLLLLLFAFLAVLFFFKSYPSIPTTTLSRPYKGQGAPRIKKVSMLYGSGPFTPLYERAIRSHKAHNERWNYPMDVLRNEISGGYWNKPSYLLSLIVNELAKPLAERVEWLMWVDADLILVNPQVPLEIFLPPAHDFPHIHYVGNKDQNGLNTGTFFLHVHDWSVKMLIKSIAFPWYWPDIDLHTSIDQEAMQHIFNESEFAGNILFQPRPWYNTYEFKHGYEGKKGSLLVHFPGLEQERWEHMNNWLDVVERTPKEWEMPLQDTYYPDALKEYWKLLREGMGLLQSARDVMKDDKENDRSHATLKQATDGLQYTLIHEADSVELMRAAFTRTKDAMPK